MGQVCGRNQHKFAHQLAKRRPVDDTDRTSLERAVATGTRLPTDLARVIVDSLRPQFEPRSRKVDTVEISADRDVIALAIDSRGASKRWYVLSQCDDFGETRVHVFDDLTCVAEWPAALDMLTSTAFPSRTAQRFYGLGLACLSPFVAVLMRTLDLEDCKISPAGRMQVVFGGKLAVHDERGRLHHQLDLDIPTHSICLTACPVTWRVYVAWAIEHGFVVR